MKQVAKQGTGPLLVGASGRVGRMVRQLWPKPGLQAQHRTPEQPGLCWPLLKGPAPFLAYVDQVGPPSCLVVLAGVTPATGRDLSLNTSLALAAVEAAKRAGVPRVLLASSSAVYGVGQGLTETAPLHPANAYGAAKLAMEAAVQPYHAALDLCVLRIGNVAGADAALLNVAGAAAGQPVEIDQFADGQGPWRSYIGADALARVLSQLAEHPSPLPDVLNLAAPHPIAMADLVAATGHPYRFHPAPATAHQRITLDCQALAGLVSFDPTDSDPAIMVADWQKTRTS